MQGAGLKRLVSLVLATSLVFSNAPNVGTVLGNEIELETSTEMSSEVEVTGSWQEEGDDLSQEVEIDYQRDVVNTVSIPEEDTQYYEVNEYDLGGSENQEQEVQQGSVIIMDLQWSDGFNSAKAENTGGDGFLEGSVLEVLQEKDITDGMKKGEAEEFLLGFYRNMWLSYSLEIGLDDNYIEKVSDAFLRSDIFDSKVYNPDGSVAQDYTITYTVRDSVLAQKLLDGEGEIRAYGFDEDNEGYNLRDFDVFVNGESGEYSVEISDSFYYSYIFISVVDVNFSITQETEVETWKEVVGEVSERVEEAEITGESQEVTEEVVEEEVTEKPQEFTEEVIETLSEKSTEEETELVTAEEHWVESQGDFSEIENYILASSVEGFDSPYIMKLSPQISTGSQSPVTADGMTIEYINIKWLSKSTGSSEPAGTGRLELSTGDGTVGNQQFQIDFSLSGKFDHDVGTVEIAIPAYIWKDRYGKEPGRLTLAVPESPDTGSDFAWKRVDDMIVFTNTHKISAATSVMIQGTFRDVNPFDMVDKDQVNSTAEYVGYSDQLYATIALVTPNEETIYMTSNSIDASIDTRASVDTVMKTAFNSINGSYSIYPESIPSDIPSELLPDNAEDYIYVRWYLVASGTGSQPFTLTLVDTIVDEYDGLLLGLSDLPGGGTLVSDDGVSASIVLQDGKDVSNRSAYAWTAYPKSSFPDEGAEYRLHNTVTAKVKGWDDEIETEKSYTGEAPYRVPKHYHVVKEWEDDNNSRGVRQENLEIWVYRNDVHWKTFYLNEDNDWSCEWSDGGDDAAYEVDEMWLKSGEFDSYYDSAGVLHRLQYSYTMKSKTYDESTRTWKFVNQYSEGWVKYEVSDIIKYTEYAHRDSYLKSTKDTDLNVLISGKEPIVQYTVSASAAVVPYTRDVLSVDADGQPLYVKDVDVIVADKKVTLAGNELSVDDYEIAYVDLLKPRVYDYYSYDDGTGFFRSREDTTPQTVSLYGLINGEWVEVAERVGDVVTAKNGSTVEWYRVYMPDDVIQVKTVQRTGSSIVHQSYNVGVRVKPSELVLGLIEKEKEYGDYLRLTLDNFADLNVLETDGITKDIEMDDWSRAWLHGRVYRVGVSAKKNFTLIGNDITARRLKLHSSASMTAQSNILTMNEYNLALNGSMISEIESGTWYDLLPVGVEPDISTVKLGSGDSILDAYTIPNWKGSGRTLLVVKGTFAKHVSLTGSDREDSPHNQGYKNVQTIEFDSYYSWDSARKYGLEGIYNRIALEVDDNKIGNLEGYEGEKNDPLGGKNLGSASAVGEDADLMTGLGDDSTKENYTYAGAVLRYDEVDMTAKVEIKKHVSIDGSGSWSYGTEKEISVEEGGNYTYRLKVETAPNTISTDVIILDSIENYIPTDDKSDYGDIQWKGNLVSIDVSDLELSGVAPVVYYNTTPGLDISGYNTRNESGVVKSLLQNGVDGWTSVAPDDMGTVTAIAIDASKKPDGTDFELEGQFPLVVYMHMKAPKGESIEYAYIGDEMNTTTNAHAYNNVYLDQTQMDGLGRTFHSYDHFEYTKVGIRPLNIDVIKEWDDTNDNDGKRPDSVVIHLYANGEDTGRLLEIKESENWKGTFYHVLPTDEDGKRIIYSFIEDEMEGYSSKVSRVGDVVTIKNSHELEKISIPFKKEWVDEENETSRPLNIAVKLYANGKSTGKTTIVKATDDWSGEFKDVLKYSGGAEINYSVEESPVEGYRDEYSNEDGVFVITNRYYPYGDLTVSKTLVNATEAASEAEFIFNLSLTDENGNPLIDKYNYVTSSGRVGKVGNADIFTLKGGEMITISDIPCKVGYSITEQSKDGFKNTSRVGETGTIHSYATSSASFTNTYSSGGRDSISVTKNLTGRALEEGKLKFRLETEEGVLIRTASNIADGSVNFGSFKYTEKDDGKDFVYLILEENEGKPGYTYDGSIYKVVVHVSDNGDGTLTFTQTYLNEDDEEVNAIGFDNEYHASGSVTLKAWKVMTGKRLDGDDFDFELLDEGYNVLQTKKNTEDESIPFDPLEFDETDVGETYTYYIREVAGNDSSINYDDTVFCYTVSVVDNGDGTLSFGVNSQNVEKVEVPGVPGWKCILWLHDFWDYYTRDMYNYWDVDARNILFSDSWEDPVSGTTELTQYFRTYIHEDTGSFDTWYENSGDDNFSGAYWYNGRADYEGAVSIAVDFGKKYSSSYYADVEGLLIDGGLSEDYISNDYVYVIADNYTGHYSYVGRYIHRIPTFKDMDFNEPDANVYFMFKRYWVKEPSVTYREVGEADAPVFQNSLKPGNLSLTKYTTWEDGEEPNPNQEFKFKVRLTDNTGSPLNLSEMEYVLEQVTNIGTGSLSMMSSDSLRPLLADSGGGNTSPDGIGSEEEGVNDSSGEQDDSQGETIEDSSDEGVNDEFVAEEGE